MAGTIVLIAVGVYAAFSVLYGLTMFRTAVAEGQTPQAAVNYALRRSWQKPAELLAKALRALAAEVFQNRSE